jgi:hypothetical protein
MATVTNAPRTEDTSGTLQQVKTFTTADTGSPVVQTELPEPEVEYGS